MDCANKHFVNASLVAKCALRHLRRWVGARTGHQSVVKGKGVRRRVGVWEVRVSGGGVASEYEAAAHERGHHLATNDISAGR